MFTVVTPSSPTNYQNVFFFGLGPPSGDIQGSQLMGSVFEGPLTAVQSVHTYT